MEIETTYTIFTILILVFSVIIHEVSHGYAALMMGDVTAKYAGRLTLNPIKHLDPFGSVILPVLLTILPGNFVLGWAKPVPYNPYNFKNKRLGELFVAAAGPLSNILLALVFGLIIRLAIYFNYATAFISLALVIVLVNLVLAIFNSLPIPPLDGSKILFNLWPNFSPQIRLNLEKHGFVILLFFVLFLSKFLFPIILFLTALLTGIPLA